MHDDGRATIAYDSELRRIFYRFAKGARFIEEAELMPRYNLVAHSEQRDTLRRTVERVDRIELQTKPRISAERARGGCADQNL